MALEVWYMDEGGHRDAEFGQKVDWDIDLLEGYPHRFFTNKGYGQSRAQRGRSAYQNPDLLEALSKHPPAIVVVHGWSYDTYIAVLRKAKKWGHRLWFRGETNLAMEKARPLWQQILRKRMLQHLLQHCEKMLAIGTHSHNFYRWLRIKEASITHTPYAVDNHRFQQIAFSIASSAARQQLNWPQDQFIFVFTGKLIEKKRPLDIVRAFALLGQSNACLVLVGDGPMRSRIESFVVEHQLQSKVLLHGFVNQQRIPLAYRAADALVMASDYGETWGLSVNEAMNAGLPLILSDRVGCYPDLLKEGRNGFGFACGDVKAMARAMENLLTKKEEELAAMGQKSLELVNTHSFEAVANALQNAEHHNKEQKAS